MLTALVIFIITYVFIGLRQIQRIHRDRPARALITAITIAAGIHVLALQVGASQGAEKAAAPARRQTITVVPSGSTAPARTFRVALICDTEVLHAKGLQGFRRLLPDEAALFIFEKPGPVTFWMGSVAYPIDIVFIGPDRTVVWVYPDRVPGSRELYPSYADVKWVVETAAGSGIKAGDRVVIK